MFEMKRRSVLTGGSSLFLLTALGGCERLRDQIANRPVRKDISTLATNDPILDAYRDAIGQMQALGSSDPRNWTKQAEIHLNTCPHGNWFFLPWHRAYLMAMDDIVRTLTGDQSFSMPYWNWTCQRAIPVAFWQSGSVLNYSPRAAGPTSQAVEAIVGPANMANILGETDFELFASGAATALRGGGGFQGLLEQGPHNYIHGFTGGTMGTYMSPLDPIFWLHHCNIDRIWFDWNSAGNANTNDPTYVNFQLNGLFVDGNSQPLEYQVGSLVLAPLLSYRYENPQPCGVTFNRLDEQALRALLEEGARQRIEVVERLDPVATDIFIGGARERSQSLPLPPRISEKAFEETIDNRLVLRLDDVSLSSNEENFFVRVFLNLPEGEKPSPDSPYYAGAFAFFVDEGHNHGPMNYAIDLSETVERLNAEQRLDGGSAPSLSFELVPIRDDEKSLVAMRSARVRIGAVRPELIARKPEAAKIDVERQ